MKKKFLEIGKIVSTHGIKGEVRVQPWCDDSELLTEFEVLYFNQGKEEVIIEDARVHKNVVVMKIQNVNDMNTAQLLRNKILYIDREDLLLDESTYFIQDLINMKVIDFDDENKVYGKIIDVTQTGANDVYHIEDSNGKVVLIPAIADVVKVTDIDNDIMKITPLKGLFDETEEIR